MKILIDAALPPGLKPSLDQAGHEARHVVEIGLRNADDAQLWDYAVRESVVILTKDEDFADGGFVSRAVRQFCGSGSGTVRVPLAGAAIALD